MDISGLLRDYQANILDQDTFTRLSLRIATGDSGGQVDVPRFLSQTTLNVEQLLSEVNQLVRGKLAIASIPSFTVTWADPSLLMDVSTDRVQQLEEQGMFQNSGHLFFLMSAENPGKSSEQTGNSANLRNNYGIKDSEILQDLEKFIREDVASIYIDVLNLSWLTPPVKSSPVQAQIETAMLNYPSRDDLSTILEMYAPLSHLRDQGLETHIPTAGITDNHVAPGAAIARSKISGLVESLEKLRNALNGKQPAGDYQPAGNYQLAGDYQPAGNYQPAGDYALSSSLSQAIADFSKELGNYALQSVLNDAIATLLNAINTKQPIGNYQSAGNYQPAGDYLLTTDSRVVNRGFHYYQANVPSNPLIGERWGELDANGLLTDEWIYSGTRWIGPHSFTAGSPQSNISTYPASSWWGYLGTKYDILVERISLAYNQSSYVASTYCSARFQLTSPQHEQINSSTPGNYKELGIVNQNSGTGSVFLEVNKIFSTSPIHLCIGVQVTKVGTATTTTFYANFGIQWRWVRKVQST